MNDHPHSHEHEPEHAHPHPAPETPMDAGSQALSEALRSSFAIVKFVMVILLVVFLGSGFFQVGPQERAIILRFGKPVGEGAKALLNPGLHWSMPYPIDEYVKVSITGIQRANSSVGWYATTPEQELAGTEPPAGPSLNPAVDGYTITADGNIIHTRAVLSYRIEEPVQYVFGFTNAAAVVQNALDNALVYTSAQFKVDDILTRDKAGFQDAVRRRVTELLEKQHTGVTVERCDVESRPPRQQQVRAAFVNVLNAEINRSKLLNDAHSYENQVTNKAGADAAARINAAESERSSLVSSLAGQAERFGDILPNYRANPELFRQQRLAETMGRVLTNVQDKIYLPQRADGKSRELRLLLNREPQKPKSDANP
ncbi:MAG: modulator of FtsH protease HflK [Verrucomicrobiota bacterium]|jgi:membrane protease subunit HflK